MTKRKNELQTPPKTPQKVGAHQAQREVKPLVAAESDMCPSCGWHLDLTAMHENCAPSNGIGALSGAGLAAYTDTHDGDTEPGAPWPEDSQA